MLRYIILMLIIYGLYRLIFNFIIPVIKVSNKMRKQVREFQNNMHNPNNDAETAQQSTPKTKQKTKGDYIDFEEVK